MKHRKLKTLLRYTGAACLIVFLSLLPTVSQALTPEQVIALKKAGVSEETIRQMIRQEEDARSNPDDTMGRREMQDAQGNTVVIYSTGRSPRPAADDAERMKLENSWKMLENMIIDGRSTGDAAAR